MKKLRKCVVPMFWGKAKQKHQWLPGVCGQRDMKRGGALGIFRAVNTFSEYIIQYCNGGFISYIWQNQQNGQALRINYGLWVVMMSKLIQTITNVTFLCGILLVGETVL